MAGFFTNMTITKPRCPSCGLDKKVKTPRMPIMGKGKKGIFILSDAPSEAEDKNGVPLSGNSGTYFSKSLRFHGISLEEDCWRVNAVRCHTTEQLKHVKCCHASIQKMLNDCQPKKIILLGIGAISSYYHEYPEVTKSIGANRGLAIWEPRYNCYVYPLMHPSMYSSSKDQCLIAAAKADLKNAFADKAQPEYIPSPVVKKLLNVDEVLTYLDWLLESQKPFAFDYEATSLKPQRKGCKPVTLGIATDGGAVAFPLNHKYWKEDDWILIKHKWTEVLKSTKNKKIVQAMHMELVWSKHVFGYCNSVAWDTQLASHIIDNREGGFFGLKFQAFLRWGVRDYSALMDSFIKAPSGGYLNRMEEAPLSSVLLYNGLDALYTYHMWKEQQFECTGTLLKAYKFFHNGLSVLCDMHLNGIAVDEKYYQEQRKILQGEILVLQNRVLSTEDAVNFKQRYSKELLLSSPDDLKLFFFDQLGFTSTKYTKKGAASVDEDVLNTIEHPSAKMILEIRKLEKILSTYVEGFLKASVDGRMHPSFTLHRVVSYRSCIAEGELVNTINGLVPIENINVGDLVTSVANGEPCISPVVWAGITGYKQIIKLTFELTTGEIATVRCTPEHRFLLKSGEYKRADLLEETDEIMEV